MSLPEKIGIESHVTEYLPEGTVRVKFRIDNCGFPSDASFPPGDLLDVVLVGSIYDLTVVQRRGRVPATPLAQGPKVSARARVGWSVVDLPLPQMRFNEYAVVAKVYSDDERYRSPFDPSNCYAGVVRYGVHAVRINLADLEDLYARVNNPLAEEEIKSLVRRGLVVAEDEDGNEYFTAEATAEENVKLIYRPLSTPDEP